MLSPLCADMFAWWGAVKNNLGQENAYFAPCYILLSLLPEGLKKVRNPDRMYRTAVCYAGHGPPKSISDDTEMNSKSYSYLHHFY